MQKSSRCPRLRRVKLTGVCKGLTYISRQFLSLKKSYALRGVIDTGKFYMTPRSPTSGSF